MRHATCAFTPWDRRAAGAGADQAPAPDRVPPADPRCRPGQPWSALVPLPLVATGPSTMAARCRGLASLTLVNLAAAVLIRQQNVLNLLFGLAGHGSRSWPLWLRWSVSNVHQVGGIHAGGALAGTVWLCAFAGVAVAAPADERDAGAHRLPRRPDGARRRLRGSAGAQPRAQRVRAFAPLRRLDRDRALLGADASPRAGRPGVARPGTRGRDREYRLAVAAAAACTHHD